MDIFANALVVVAYVVALAVLIRLRGVFRVRDGRRFAVLMGAMVVLVGGHLLAGRPLAAWINLGGALALAATWWSLGRRDGAGAGDSAGSGSAGSGS